MTDISDIDELGSGRDHPSRRPQFTVGSEGIWTFIFVDMVVFGLIFLTFTVQRIDQYELYQTAHESLNVVYGFINTLILLTSSLFVVRAVGSARLNNFTKMDHYLKLALGMGLAFFVSKSVEYWGKFDAGIGITTNSFFTFYFFVTFLHLLHLLGVAVFMVVYWRRTAVQVSSPRYVTGLENIGLFWHFVDLLWVFIFTLLYLM